MDDTLLSNISLDLLGKTFSTGESLDSSVWAYALSFWLSGMFFLLLLFISMHTKLQEKRYNAASKSYKRRKDSVTQKKRTRNLQAHHFMVPNFCFSS